MPARYLSAVTDLRRVGRKLALSLASALGFFALLELGLRAFGFSYPPYDPPIVLWDSENDRELASASGLHRADPRQLWETRPDALVKDGDPERINAAGFRGPERARERTSGVLRVATLGDSSTFGLGVAYGDTYSARLEALLVERGRPAEVLDFGVIGYTVRQGIERFAARAAPYRPDVVVAAFGAVNEHFASKMGRDEEKIARAAARDTQSARCWRWAREEIRALALLARAADEMRGGRAAIRQRWFERWQGQLQLEATMGQVDWPGERRVSPAEMEEFLGRLRTAVEAAGAELVVVLMPRDLAYERANPVLEQYTAAVRHFALGAGVELVDAYSAFRAGAPTLFLPGDVVHPSPEGHALIARGLADRIEALAPAGASR